MKIVTQVKAQKFVHLKNIQHLHQYNQSFPEEPVCLNKLVFVFCWKDDMDGPTVNSLRRMIHNLGATTKEALCCPW